jgi:hypothetical protein
MFSAFNHPAHLGYPWLKKEIKNKSRREDPLHQYSKTGGALGTNGAEPGARTHDLAGALTDNQLADDQFPPQESNRMTVEALCPSHPAVA